MGDNDIINNEKEIEKIDNQDMYGFIMKMPNSTTEMLKKADEIQVPFNIKDFNNILICGMGGSAIGGNLIQDLLLDKINIPIIIHRGYDLPAFASHNTLLITISYSGNTEETLSVFAKGFKCDCKIVSISSNGKLLDYCKRLEIPHIEVPSDIQPRAAIPYLFVSLLILLQKIRAIDDIAKDVEESIIIMEKLRDELSINKNIPKNIAKIIAMGIKGRIPIVYAPPGYGSLARRMKCQINENSKNLATWDVFPELNHNEIVGFESTLEISKKSCVILLRTEDEDEAIKNRIEITKEIILKDKVKEIHEIWAQGKSKLARMFSLLFIGDLISYYLAIIKGVDPTPVKGISELKKKIEEKLNLLDVIEKNLFSS